MSTPTATRLGCATVYAAMYVVSIVIAVMSLAAPGGGIPFVVPLFLGLPWTLFMSLLFLFPIVPNAVVRVLMLVLPLAINVCLILWARGTAGDTKSFRLVRATRAKPPEARRPLDGTHPDTAPHDSDRGP